MGLCPPEGVSLDDGGTYQPSRFQKKTWKMFQEFWEWGVGVTEGEPYDVVFNGDAIDGDHHGATTQISHNIGDQIGCAVQVLKPVAERCRASGGRYYHIRGTEAHVGKSAEREEQLAELLGAMPDEEGRYARWDMWKRLPQGGLVHFLHHIGTTGSAAFESTAIMRELVGMFTEAGRWRRNVPDIVVRGHAHRYVEVRVPSARRYNIGTVLPAWQGKGPYVWKSAGMRIQEPQFGGIVIREGAEELYTRAWVRSIERPKEEI